MYANYDYTLVALNRTVQLNGGKIILNNYTALKNLHSNTVQQILFLFCANRPVSSAGLAQWSVINRQRMMALQADANFQIDLQATCTECKHETVLNGNIMQLNVKLLYPSLAC